MSGGSAPPVILPVPAPPVISRIGAPAAPTAVYSPVPGVQGPAGGQGPAGIQTGFGQIVYTHALTGMGDQIAPNTRTQLTFTPDPALTINYLNPPFAGYVLWDNTKVVGRHTGDVLLIQVNLQVTPAVEGGQIFIDLDVGSKVGPIASDSESLGANASIMQRISGKLICQTNANFMANGGKVYITTTVPAMVLRESIFIIPLSTYAGP